MQIPSGYRVESSNTLDLRDLHVAGRSHHDYSQGIPPTHSATPSNGLYMTSKFLPGPSQLFPTENIAGSIDTHHGAEPPYYPRSSSYSHPSHTASADPGSRYGNHHSQLLSNSETLTPSTNQAFQTQPLPETSWASSGIAANSTSQTNPASEEFRYPSNHKHSQSASYPVPAFTPPLTGREGFRSFGSSAHPGENQSLYLNSASDNLEQTALPPAPFDHYGRLQSSNPFPSPNHLSLNNPYRSNSTAPNVYPASSGTDTARSFPPPADNQHPSVPPGSQPGGPSKVDESSQSLDSSNSEMNPFPEYPEDSRKRMRYMEEALAPGGQMKDYPGDKGISGNKRDRKGESYLGLAGEGA